MKNLHLTIPDELHEDLRSICTHHGDLTYLVRAFLTAAVADAKSKLESRKDSAGTSQKEVKSHDSASKRK